MTRQNLFVPAISCNHCKMSIEKALSLVNGVGVVSVDVTSKTVDLEFDENQTTLVSICEALEEIGFEVQEK